MFIAKKFRPTSEGQLDELVSRIRLGTIVAHGSTAFCATPLPWVPIRTSTGALQLFGHYANKNPDLEVIRGNPDVVVIFVGANAYVSPRGLPTPKSAPTWNYVTVHIHGQATLLDEPNTEAAIELLITAMESKRPKPWSSTEMAERRDQLIRHVTGVRVDVTRVDAKLKLGQNESLVDLPCIIRQLQDAGQHELVGLMEQANSDRLTEKPNWEISGHE